MKTKICTRCCTRRKVDFYTKSESTADGITAICRPCRAALMRSYRANGTTRLNEFETRKLTSLEATFVNLRDAFKKHGFTIAKRKLSPPKRT